MTQNETVLWALRSFFGSAPVYQVMENSLMEVDIDQYVDAVCKIINAQSDLEQSLSMIMGDLYHVQARKLTRVDTEFLAAGIRKYVDRD